MDICERCFVDLMEDVPRAIVTDFDFEVVCTQCWADEILKPHLEPKEIPDT